MATCLSCAAGKEIDPARVIAAVIQAMEGLDLNQKALLMDRYRADCLTLGKQVVILRGDQKQYGTALALTEDGSLTVRLTDDAIVTVGSGEVSVRGLYGYV